MDRKHSTPAIVLGVTLMLFGAGSFAISSLVLSVATQNSLPAEGSLVETADTTGTIVDFEQSGQSSDTAARQRTDDTDTSSASGSVAYREIVEFKTADGETIRGVPVYANWVATKPEPADDRVVQVTYNTAVPKTFLATGPGTTSDSETYHQAQGNVGAGFGGLVFVAGVVILGYGIYLSTRKPVPA